MKKLLIALLFLISVCTHAEEADALLNKWINAQTNIQTWSADFVQTRHLKSLAQPLSATGHVWFAAPNQFRWELGNPPQIALRQPQQMLIIYPKLKRVEKYRLDMAERGPWKDALALLETGFPRSLAELEGRFTIQDKKVEKDVCVITLQPKSPGAKRLMPEMKIEFGVNDLALRATELQFADGSTMRNDFKTAEVNAKLPDGIFSPDLSEYKTVEPLASSGKAPLK